MQCVLLQQTLRFKHLSTVVRGGGKATGTEGRKWSLKTLVTPAEFLLVYWQVVRLCRV